MINDVGLYMRDYFVQHYAHDEKREQMYWLEYTRLSDRVPLGGAVLDIGCGTGGFLANFGSHWQVYGFEPSGYAHALSVGKGIEMFFNLDEIPDGSMDVVVFRGTLQHISEPMHALEQATRILKAGGLLVVLATPDTDSLVYRIWFDLPALEAGRNWVLFGNRFLQNILRRLGYEQIEVLHPYLGTPYARPILDGMRFMQSLFFGFRKFAFPGNMMEMYARKSGDRRRETGDRRRETDNVAF
jgi:SAM-dependent methyltransferase